MLLKTESIVIRTVKYRDTSVICDILTREMGMLTIIAGGVRKNRSRMSASLFQPPSLLEAVLYYKDSSNMHRLKEARPAIPMMRVFEDLKRIAISQFIAELLKKTIKNRESQTELFEFVRETICSLEAEDVVNPDLPILFMLNLASHLGISPEFNRVDTGFLDLREGVAHSSPPPHNQFLNEEQTHVLKKLNASKKGPIPIQKSITDIETRRQLFNHMVDYYTIHVDGMTPLKSPDIFRAVFER